MKPCDSAMSINGPCGLKLKNEAQVRLHKKVCKTCASLPSYKVMRGDLKLNADLPSPASSERKLLTALKSKASYEKFSTVTLLPL